MILTRDKDGNFVMNETAFYITHAVMAALLLSIGACMGAMRAKKMQG